MIQQAAHDHVAQKIPIPLHLFLANSNSVSDGNRLKGWNSLLPREQIQATWIDGDHFSIMTMPHIQALGAQLTTALTHSR